MPREVEVGQAVGQAVCRRRGSGGPGGLPGQVEVEGGLLAKAMPRSSVAPAQTLEVLILPSLEVGQAVVEQEGGLLATAMPLATAMHLALVRRLVVAAVLAVVV